MTRTDWYHIRGRLGLFWPLKLYASKAFLLCAVAAPLVWAIMASVVPVHSMSLVHVWSLGFASAVLWYPLWEELLFRGLLQGELIERGWTHSWVFGLSGANIIVSLVFTAVHLWSHSPIWAALVFLPSLVFGYLRDRFNSTVPSIVMHMWYNGGYFFFIDSVLPSTESDVR
ncbi:MAG TPA: JDVT-CTERM system glutamic-type intramembrane protease [Nitrospira sp.]|nr:JDVT-CTERM system glutamic-type intramembrane protease [Nitrospira sp.]